MHKISAILNKENLDQVLKEVKHPKLYLFDIKDFEALTLRYGDDAGNFVLDSLASSLKKYADENDMQAFYIQNDEFVLLQDKPFDLEEMEKQLFAFLAFCENQTFKYSPLDVDFEIELTLGICFDRFNLLEKAYKAVNLAKLRSRPFVTYSEFVNQEWDETQKFWGDIIDKAIKEKRLVPYFQAVFDINGEVCHFEALSRIIVDNETKSPSEFLNIAKSQNLTTDITLEMIKFLKNTDFQKPCTLNLGMDDLRNEKIIETIRKNENLLFEIPSDAIKIDKRAIAYFLEQTKLSSKRVILDNVSSIGMFEEEGFGTDNISALKISGNLIKNIHLDAIAVKRVEQIIQFAHENDIKIIATHINSQTSFEKAKELNIDFFQGYHLQIPSDNPSLLIKSNFKG